MSMVNLTVIVPVKNEQKNVESLVKRIHAALVTAGISYKVIFVDDRSTDKTEETLRKLKNSYPITVLRKKGREGKAFCILEGAAAAESDILAMLDADLQYPPEALPSMYRNMEKYGVVVANRKRYKNSLIRRVASRAISYVFGKLLFGLPFDIQSGLKMFRKDIITHVQADSVQAWALDIPLLTTARELGYTIGSVNITFERRREGHSKVHYLSSTWEIAKGALSARMHPKRTFLQAPNSANSMAGAGLIHKRKRYTTHTTLPLSISALETFGRWQKIAFVVFVISMAAGFLTYPWQTAISLIAVLSAIYFIDVLFNLFLIIKSLHQPPEVRVSNAQIAALDEKKLPVYSILCPLYKEVHVISQFVDAINQLDWPKDKLDVQLLLEEDDVETIRQIERMTLPPYFRITVVPDSEPKTKPKACNWGLAHAKGEYAVIFDAEDIPEPMQLKKAYIAFLRLPQSVACLQAKLNYYNPSHNMLTRLFTAEYSLWFDVMLNGLQSIATAIPLGGTSNHFRTRDLIKLRGWDPFNVTEDCDLGVRLFAAGYKTAIIDSTTLEEANSRFGNWLRQRSRWIKGYIQTYLVHMRNPVSLTRSLGIHAVFFQLIVGGKIAFMLINPILWLATIAYFSLYAYVGPTIERLYPTWVFYMAASSLAFGNFLFVYYYMIGVAIRGHWSLMKYIFFVPFYWLMVSMSAGIAVFQLLFKPHYWEKTVHGFHLQAVPLKKIDMREKSVPTFSFPRPAFSLFTSGSLLIAASVAGNFFNFLYNAYLGRSITLSDFGMITLFGSFIYIGQVIFNSLSSTVTYRTGYLYGKYSRPVFSFWRKTRGKSFLIACMLAGVWLAATPFLMPFFHTTEILPFLLFTPVWIIGMLGAVDGGFLSGTTRFTILAVLVFSEAIIKFMITVIFVQIGQTHLVYAATPISMTVSLVVGWMFIISQPKISEKVTEREAMYFPKRFFSASILSKLSTVAFLTADILLAKHFLSAEDAGKYALVSLVGKMIYFIGSLFGQFIIPLISREEGAGRGGERIFYKIIGAVTLMTLGGFAAVGIGGFYTVPLLFGSRANAIIMYLPAYTLALAFISIANSIAAFHQAKKQYVFSVISFLASCLTMAGIMLFHQSIFSIIWVVLATSVIFLTTMLFMHVYYHHMRFFVSNSTDFFGLFNKVPSMVTNTATLRILIFNWRDTRHVWAGGAEAYIHEIAKQWVATGHTVTLFCGNDSKNPRNQVVDGVQVVRRGGFYTVYLWAFLYYVLKFRGSFDVIIDSENGVPFFTPLFVKKPIFLLIHHVHQQVFREHLRFPFDRIAMFIESKIMPMLYRSHRIITVSESSQKEIIRLQLHPGKTVDVIHPGISPDAFVTSPKTKYPSFTYIGRLKPYKNIDIAVKAFARVRQLYPNSRFFIGGDGESLPLLKKLAASLDLGKSVIFLGKVDENKKRRLLASSWAAVQPSSLEGWGITVIEANAAGTPVIAANVNGLRDSVLNGKTGMLIPVKQVASLEGAMEHIIKHPAERLRLSREAVMWAKEFSWEKSASQLESILTAEVNEHAAHTIAISNPALAGK